MSLVDPSNPCFWSDGTPRSMHSGFTRGLSDDRSAQFIAAVMPSPMARVNPGQRGRGKKRPIEQLTPAGELVRLFPSISEAARACGVPDPNIVRAASGIRNTAGGFRWRYVEVNA